MRIRLTLFMLFLAPLLICAQQFQDSVTFVLPAGNQRGTEIYNQLEQARSLNSSNPKEALDKVEKALEMSVQSKDKQAEGWSYHTFGLVSYQLGKYDLAIQHFEKALGLFREVENEEGLNNAYQNLALSHEKAGNYGRSLEFFLISAKRAERNGNSKAFMQAQKDIARVYFKMKEFPLAANRYKTLLEMYRKNNDEAGIADSYNNLGTVYLEMADTAKAIEYYKLATHSATIASDTFNLVNGYNNLTNVYQQQRSNYGEQISYQKQVLELNKKKRDSRVQSEANISLARSYLSNNNTIQAIPYLESSIKINQESGQLKEQSKAVEALSKAYEELGDYKKALESYKSYVSIVDSLQARQEEEEAAALALNEEISRREERIELLVRSQDLTEKEMEVLRRESLVQEEGLERQRWINGLLVGLLGVTVLAGFLIWRSSRARRKANQLLALKSLRSQMNPHFIFNSLNSVNSFIASNDERSANKFLSEFSRLMRAVLDNSQHEFISLSREVEILGIYLNLEHFRFKDKFEYSFQVAPDLEQDSLSVPPMLIQPYIENAIWHGLRYKPEKGFLKVEISKDAHDIVVKVEDNGIGRARSLELKTMHQKEHNSTGLKNTSERLNIINELYQTQLTVSIEDLQQNGKAAGTRVTLRIPLRHALDREDLTI
ncbi:MAG: tetratricopeptide repeat protein [Bacteroidia bacterium]|nr:tetratricopeptide repeat protein [Bacteroidia bacterium]